MITRIALILAAAILIGGCGTPTKPDPVEGQSRETAEPTMAEVWAQSAQTSLDMNMETFFSQMPDDLSWARCGRAVRQASGCTR